MPVKLFQPLYNHDKTLFERPDYAYEPEKYRGKNKYVKVGGSVHKKLLKIVAEGGGKEWAVGLPPPSEKKKKKKEYAELKTDYTKEKAVKIKMVLKKEKPKKEKPKKEKTKKRKIKIRPNKNVIDLYDFGDAPVLYPSRSIIDEPMNQDPIGTISSMVYVPSQKVNNVSITQYTPPSVGSSVVNKPLPEPKQAPESVKDRMKKAIASLEKEAAQRKQYREAGREVIKRRGKKIEQTIAGKKARGPIKEPKLSFAQVLAGKGTDKVSATLSFADILAKGRGARRFE